ncbi:MAG: hypothetical protein JOS17DRAFT_497587 [Linnemannia elongata]|nr:MAG: hypothetical protein JOS17DRAFT_497587 [Linnemannia elongata]
MFPVFTAGKDGKIHHRHDHVHRTMILQYHHCFLLHRYCCFHRHEQDRLQIHSGAILHLLGSMTVHPSYSCYCFRRFLSNPDCCCCYILHQSHHHLGRHDVSVMVSFHYRPDHRHHCRHILHCFGYYTLQRRLGHLRFRHHIQTADDSSLPWRPACSCSYWDQTHRHLQHCSHPYLQDHQRQLLHRRQQRQQQPYGNVVPMRPRQQGWRHTVQQQRRTWPGKGRLLVHLHHHPYHPYQRQSRHTRRRRPSCRPCCPYRSHGYHQLRFLRTRPGLHILRR